MANQTRDLAFSKSAYANQASPNTATVPSSGSWYRLGRDGDYKNRCMYLGGLAAWPSSLKRNRIISAKLRYYIQAGDMEIDFETVKGSFTPSAVTWNNKPTGSNYNGYGIAFISDLGISAGYTGDIWIDVRSRTTDLADGALGVIKEGGVEIYGSNYNGASGWYGKSVLSGGGAPYLRVTYSDSDIVKSKVVIGTKLSGTVNPEVANKITWSLQKNGSYRCYDETWVQASAKVLWKATTESSWHTINISGATMSATIPAFTFPTGKTIQYYVQATDADGTTTNTDTYSFTTPASQITPQNSPTSGYRNPRENITFSWYFKHTNGNYAQSSASLFWRIAGTSTWTEVPASGSTMQVTVPGSAETQTFPPASTIEWYLYGVDSSGSSSQTSVYSFSTSASIITAVCKTPVNNVEDGSAPINFQWELWSNDGYAASRTVFMWKATTESSWHTAMNVTRTVTNITVAAGTFPAGEIDWKVRADNIDGTQGVEGQASFICVAAPDPVLGLVATPVPITTISWQSEGQEAYEISIDGEVVQKAFGPAVYSWTVPEPLTEGEHVISVRIQGIYGLWSQPAETSIQVEGPAAQTVLEGEFGLDAVLTSGTEYPLYTIRYYRDGKLIGTAPGGTRFVDRHVLGTHEYFTRRFWGDGRYDQSNTVVGTMYTTDKMIADFSGGEWINIELSENSNEEQSFDWNRTAAWLHVTGAKFPVLEMSPYEDRVGSYNCAFIDDQAARAFERFKGKTVIIKRRKGNVIVGAMTSLSKRVLHYYTAFSFTIQEIEWEDYVEYDETD